MYNQYVVHRGFSADCEELSGLEEKAPFAVAHRQHIDTVTWAHAPEADKRDVVVDADMRPSPATEVPA